MNYFSSKSLWVGLIVFFVVFFTNANGIDDTFADHFSISENTIMVADTTKKYKPNKLPKFQVKDKIGNQYTDRSSNSPFILKNPKEIADEFLLDKEGKINITEKIKSLPYRNNYKPGERISYEEFSKLQQNEYLKNYWKSYSSSLDGNSESKGRGLLPKIKLPPVLDRIFGSDLVDIKLSGSILVDLGYRHQFIDVPTSNSAQTNNSQFVFDLQNQLSVDGKIGDKINLNLNFDTQASFNFQNQLKLDWRADEEDIVQSVEAGNIGWKLNGQLIPGVDNLFGAKVGLRFGKLDMTLVAAQQQSKQECITIRGGTQGKGFEIRADEYDENRHFFLSNFFRDNFEKSLKNLPMINSGLIITRVEVYVTNRTRSTESLRNIVALSDLAESSPYNKNSPFVSPLKVGSPDNVNNGLFKKLTDPASAATVREPNKVITTLSDDYKLINGVDFDIIKGAKRLTENEFSFDPQLGYISLLSPIRNDEVLAVSYEYTYKGAPHKVGEVSSEYQGQTNDKMLVMKLLKSSTIRNNLTHPMWNLMMKNIYSLKTSQVSKQGFQLKVIYKDDLTGFDNPFLQEGKKIKDIPLLRVMNLDKLNQNGDLQADGNFDFVEGVTIDSKTGRIMFPVLEPFGESNLGKFFDETETQLKEKYVYNDLYTKTFADATQNTTKNKYFLKGFNQGGVGGSLNLPIGTSESSLKVTAGGVALNQGTDFMYDQSSNRVEILNAGVGNSSREIIVCFEKQDLISNQTRALWGTRLDYRLTKDINLGATYQNLSESPPASLSRVAIGQEPVNNTVLGLDANFIKKSRFLTKMVDALPLISTKELSAVEFNGEYAQIIPKVNKYAQNNAFIDDFESNRASFGFTGDPNNWRPAATPSILANGNKNDVNYNARRAKIAAYSVDQNYFYSSNDLEPTGLNKAELVKYTYERPILATGLSGLFKNKQLQPGYETLSGVLDVAYFPSERGIYNYSTDLTRVGQLKNPKQNFGAITHAITSDTDFDNSNIEQLEFWMMDPFDNRDPKYSAVRDGRINPVNNQNGKPNSTGGSLYFNLGDISEDFVPDHFSNYENGIPATDKQFSGGNSAIGNVEKTTWGLAPTQQFVVNAFDNSDGSRQKQDVGFDGLPNSSTDPNDIYTEQVFFKDYLTQIKTNLDPEEFAKIEADPSGDDFIHFNSPKKTGSNSVIERYSNYLGIENNSPASNKNPNQITETNRLLPDIEDVNNDNTINEIESYYEYKVDLKPGQMDVGKAYIVDKSVENGVNWYLFRIPVRNFTGKVGNINGFKSIRFARMYLTDFEEPVVLRFAQLQLSGYNYRKFTGELNPRSLQETPEKYDPIFKVSTVNIEENGPGAKGGSYIPYVVPPGYIRDVDVTTQNQIALNEQSMSLCVDDLHDGDARAVFKNSTFDFINYKNLKMFVHLESPDDVDKQVSAFLRLGTDNTDNYYEVEMVGLKQTKQGQSQASEVWPKENEFNVSFETLKKVKIQRDQANKSLIELFTAPQLVKEIGDDGIERTYRISVLGRPDMSSIQTMMIGIRNPKTNDGLSKKFCIWVNELRAAGFDATVGRAAIGKVNIKLADFANVTANAAYKTFGYGGVQTKISDREREATLEVGVAATVKLDKFLPAKWGVNLPMFVSYDKKLSDPFFDPLDPDIKVDDKLKSIPTQGEKDKYLAIRQDKTVSKSVNFANVGKTKAEGNTKNRVYDIENFNLSYAYSEIKRSNTLIDDYNQTNHNGGITYTFTNTPKVIEPFKKWKTKHPMLKIIKDFNFSPSPNTITLKAEMQRNFVKTQYRNSDFTTLGVDPLYEKLWTFNRNSNLGWNLTKSLVVTYQSDVKAIIDEPSGAIDSQEKRDSIKANLRSLGRAKNLDQSMSFVWRLPLSKMPITDWMSADYSHKFGYVYTANAFDIKDDSARFFGNFIKNSRDRTITGKIDLVSLYNRIKSLRIANSPRPIKKDMARNPGDDEDIIKNVPQLGRNIKRLLMLVRGMQLNYNINETTSLAGFLPNPGLLGLSKMGSAPGWGFITGSQDPNVRIRAAENGWLSRSVEINTPFVQTKTQTFSYKTQIEPYRDFKVQLEGKITKTERFQELYLSTGENRPFASNSKNRSGGYSTTFLSFLTAFQDQENVFQKFRENRAVLQERLQKDNPIEGKYQLNSQDVLIPAFFAAYSGASENKVKYSPFYDLPFPNWRIDFSGLQNVGWFKKRFSTFVLTHSYTSTYSVGEYNTSNDYSNFGDLSLLSNPYPLSSKIGEDGFLRPVFLFGSDGVQFKERFAPLIGINAMTKSKVSLRLEYNQNREISLNPSSQIVYEITNKDLVVSAGFTKANMLLPIKRQGKRIKLPNDLKFNASFTIRQTKDMTRFIDAQAVANNAFFNLLLNPTITYDISNRLNFTAYYEKSINDPLVLSGTPFITSSRGGFRIMYTLGDL